MSNANDLITMDGFKSGKRGQLAKPVFDGYVVAIGASAGGLNALELFFHAMPVDSGASFVVIQHLSPDHVSMMDKLLSRHTAMPVLIAENQQALVANHIYLIPPGKIMRIAGDRLLIKPKAKHGLSLPIDAFFMALAQEYQAHAVAVVLSGTGSDGTRGGVAIKDANGFLLAQDPENAAFDGMPRSVMATGLVDVVMDAKALAARIYQHVTQLQPIDASQLVSPHYPPTTDSMDTILNVLYREGGVNFKDYKPLTVQRRIARRMQIKGKLTLEAYVQLLQEDRAEVLALKRDTLIPVTRFFRDHETFTKIEEIVIANLLSLVGSHQTLRVWIAACATGEEAYSYAILFAEAREKYKKWPQVKIFATDVEQSYIDFASAGVYPEAISKEISPERLERFFTPSGNHYVINSEIRQTIIFAKHNILEDPPFTKMHVVSCRNCLIYFDTPAQEKALLRFQYALVKDGYFVQGSSESLGIFSQYYQPISAKNKIYALTHATATAVNLDHVKAVINQPASLRRPVMDRKLGLEDALIAYAQTTLLDTYAVPSLLVNQHRQLLHVFGDASPYMQIQQGDVSLDVARLLLNKLSPVVIALIHKVTLEHKTLYSEIHLATPSHPLQDLLRVTVRPLAQHVFAEKNFLISFESVSALHPMAEIAAAVDVNAAFTDRILALENDLHSTRDSLQAAIEELETSNEELQATNEELMAANEEMQSTNEELQSVNEELYTVNSENQEKIEILNRLNVDLDNMTRAAEIPTIYLDEQFQIRRFSFEMGQIFRIRESDIGRRIDDFQHSMAYPEFMTDLYNVLNDMRTSEREVRLNNNQWLLVRILPYFDVSKKVNGVVVTFFDITYVKDAHKTQAILDTLNANIALIDAQGVIMVTNKAWKRFAEDNGDIGLQTTGVGQNYLQMCRAQEGTALLPQDNVYQGILDVIQGKRTEFSVTYPCHAPHERRWYVLHVAPLQHVEGGAVISHFNITKWYQELKDEAI